MIRLIILFFCLLPIQSYGQMISPTQNEAGFVTYDSLYKSFKKDSEYVDGDYFVLVSAEWCSPCNALKQKLKDNSFFGNKIALVDLDAESDLASRLMAPKKTIPQLIRYRITENGKKIVKSFRDSESLEEFFKK